jgi:hypothetical protein
MTKLKWDQVGEKVYETGTDRGVLYVADSSLQGGHRAGVPWNGLVSVTESPEGAEANAQYADNIKYVDIRSAETFKGTVEAFTYPDDWAECDGSARPAPGVYLGQQRRRGFALSYRTLIGNDVDSTDYGSKLHIIYGATASPSEKQYQTVNESPEAMTLSWEIDTTPVPAPAPYKPVSTITIDSTEVSPASFAQLENILYGTAGTDARLPSVEEVVALFDGNVDVEVAPVAPTYNPSTDTITIPNVTGVVYYIDGEAVTGSVVITEDTIVSAQPAPNYKFPAVSDDDWLIKFT